MLFPKYDDFTFSVWLTAGNEGVLTEGTAFQVSTGNQGGCKEVVGRLGLGGGTGE